MRDLSHLEMYRYKGSDLMQAWGSFGDAHNGMFHLPSPVDRQEIKVVASDGMGWDHVSVSKERRPPLWREMCWIKDQFFDEEDCVVQYHPPKSQYVNFHPNCLHLWKLTAGIMPIPPTILIGPK
jgi:hypothetical protein